MWLPAFSNSLSPFSLLFSCVFPWAQFSLPLFLFLSFSFNCKPIWSMFVFTLSPLVLNLYLPLDDDADPFELMSQVETVKEKKKKKKKEDEDKKKQKKPGHKESQKDRRLPLASDGQDLAPGELNTPPPPSLWFPILSFTHNQLQTILAAARISGFGWCSQER